jgi:hypothetical protein
MCVHCARHVRNNRPRTVTTGYVNFLAHSLVRNWHTPIPLFSERAANIAVDAAEYAIRRARTNRNVYNRARAKRTCYD